MRSEFVLIIVICSLVGTFTICSCLKCYLINIKQERKRNKIRPGHKKFKQINIVTPITEEEEEEEVKDEKLNDIKTVEIETVEIRTAEHLV